MSDTVGRTFSTLLRKEQLVKYSGHDTEGVGIAWFAVGNGVDALYGSKTNQNNMNPLEKAWYSKITSSSINDALANEKWYDYIYRMGERDNPSDQYRWVVVAVSKGWPESSGFLRANKRMEV
jgi:hypothetical protein